MRSFRAGLIAAGLAATVVGSLAVVPARAQDAGQDRGADSVPYQTDNVRRHVPLRPQYRYRVQAEPRAAVQSQVQNQSKDHVKVQAKAQPKDQVQSQTKQAQIKPAQDKPAQAPSKDQAKDQAKDRPKDQAKAPVESQSAEPKDQAKAAVPNPAADQPKDQAAKPTEAPGAVPAPTQTQDQAQNSDANCPGNPNALGTSRVLAIDPADYKRLGHMQYPDSLPLNDKEVVLTFDDGPLPPYSNQILDILASQCVKATYFLVGEMAVSFPQVVRRIYEEGHTIGTHSDHHPSGFDHLSLERLRMEIDGGIADVSSALGGDRRFLAPFFRVPGLERSDMIESELAARGLIVFSSDTLADDWHRNITPALITSLAISRLEALGKGILLLHDIHPKTVAALPNLLAQLKEHGFHIVQVVPSAAYEMAMVRKPAATRILASAVPGELTLSSGMDEGGAVPIWPKAADGVMSEKVALPAPDAAAFDPDAGSTVDNSAEMQWPVPNVTVAPPPAEPQRRWIRPVHRRTGNEGQRAERGPRAGG
jgi:peptidoglycan/xylan/chitin deacetylase (PgdA/CDA1 family)